MTDSQRTDFPASTEHRVQRDRGSLYVRDFLGRGAERQPSCCCMDFQTTRISMTPGVE